MPKFFCDKQDGLHNNETSASKLLRTVNEIPSSIEAYFYFKNHLFSPITLHKKLDHTQLWKILSHKNMDLFEKDAEGKIVFMHNYRTYMCEAKIVDIITLGERFIKITPLSQLILLQRRSVVRVPYKEPFYAKTEGNIIRGSFCDISEQGCKISLPPSPMLHPGQHLLIEWKVEGRKKEALLKIVYMTKIKNMILYGALFEKFDLTTKQFLRNITYRYCKDRPQLLSPSSKP